MSIINYKQLSIDLRKQITKLTKENNYYKYCNDLLFTIKYTIAYNENKYSDTELINIIKNILKEKYHG